jgi:hypothetical protein
MAHPAVSLSIMELSEVCLFILALFPCGYAERVNLYTKLSLVKKYTHDTRNGDEIVKGQYGEN